MKTIVFHISDPMREKEKIQQAAALLRGGKLLAIPTETVYGLGANALDSRAVSRIFVAKGRPQDNPLIIHIPEVSWLERYCEDIPPEAYRLAELFWPGPLTMLLKRKPCIPDIVTAGLPTVGVRCPRHPVTAALIQAAGVPVAAPSANLSGSPSPTTAEHVRDDLDGRIEGIVDGGPSEVGVESTIVDLTVRPACLLRPGGITPEQLRAALGGLTVDKAVMRSLGEGEKPRAPGMKYRHYAPAAAMTLVRGEAKKAAEYINRRPAEGAAVLCFDEETALYPGFTVLPYGSSSDPGALAHNVFGILRKLDKMKIRTAYARYPEGEGLNFAVQNRLNKAAGFHIVDV